jgi:hypothetical protein
MESSSCRITKVKVLTGRATKPIKTRGFSGQGCEPIDDTLGCEAEEKIVLAISTTQGCHKPVHRFPREEEINQNPNPEDEGDVSDLSSIGPLHPTQPTATRRPLPAQQSKQNDTQEYKDDDDFEYRCTNKTTS